MRGQVYEHVLEVCKIGQQTGKRGRRYSHTYGFSASVRIETLSRQSLQNDKLAGQESDFRCRYHTCRQLVGAGTLEYVHLTICRSKLGCVYHGAQRLHNFLKVPARPRSVMAAF